MRWLIAFVLAFFSSFASANGPIYAELQWGAGGVQNSDLDFYPTFGSINAGVYLVPHIGLEVFADTGLTSQRKKGFDMELDQAYGVALRFESPPRRLVQGFITLGAVNYTLDQSSEATGSFAATNVNDDFTGMRASIGVVKRLQQFPNLLVSAEYRHYNAGEPLRLDALVIGLRLNAR